MPTSYARPHPRAVSIAHRASRRAGGRGWWCTGRALGAALLVTGLTGCGASRGSAAAQAEAAARREPTLVAPAVMQVDVAVGGGGRVTAGSTVRVQLRAADDSTLIVAEASRPATGGRPYQLRLPIEPTLLDPRRSYAVAATITRRDGRVMLRTARQTAFLAGFLPDAVELTVAPLPR